MDGHLFRARLGVSSTDSAARGHRSLHLCFRFLERKVFVRRRGAECATRESSLRVAARLQFRATRRRERSKRAHSLSSASSTGDGLHTTSLPGAPVAKRIPVLIATRYMSPEVQVQVQALRKSKETRSRRKKGIRPAGGLSGRSCIGRHAAAVPAISSRRTALIEGSRRQVSHRGGPSPGFDPDSGIRALILSMSWGLRWEGGSCCEEDQCRVSFNGQQKRVRWKGSGMLFFTRGCEENRPSSYPPSRTHPRPNQPCLETELSSAWERILGPAVERACLSAL